MKSAQMGAAACAPWMRSVFGIKLGVVVVAHPHNAQQVLVKPANHASWLVPVLPAAGAVNPMFRTPAPVPQ
jgi:hypothetical protein